MSPAAGKASARPLWTPTSLARPRRLGRELALPRARYLVYLPCTMLAAGLLCFLVPTDSMLFAGSLVLSVLSLMLLYELVLTGGPLRFSSVLVFAMSFGYGLGTMTSWLGTERGGLDLAVFYHRDPVIVTRGMGGVLVALALVLALGELAEKPVFGEEFRLEFSPQAGLYLFVATCLLAASYATGSNSFGGAETTALSQVSIFGSFTSWLLMPTFALTVTAMLNTPKGLARRAYQALVGAQFLLILPTSRRQQLFAVMMAVMTVRLGRYRLTWSWPRKIVAGVLLAGLLYVTTIALFYTRLARDLHVGKGNYSFFQRIEDAWSYFQNTSYADVQAKYAKNVNGRTFVLGFLAELEDYSTHFAIGYGEDIWEQFKQSVPSLLFPNKQLGWNEEGLADQLFGTTYFDEANSVLTMGAIDLSYFGMVFYPLLFAFLIRGFAEVLGQTLPTFVACYLIVQLVATLILPEVDPIAYFVSLRGDILFFGFIWGVVSLPVFRFRREA